MSDAAITATPKKPTAATAADPWDDPGAYLRSRKWMPLGSPGHPATMWLDSEAPLGQTEKRVPLFFVDANGQKQPTMTIDRKGNSVQATQCVVTSGRQPTPLREAMELQLARDGHPSAQR